MLLRLSRASFWLAALAAVWALVAPGKHETLLTAVAGVAVLAAIALWRSAMYAQQRGFVGDAAVPQGAVLTNASLVDAAAAIARIADQQTSFETALRSVADVLKAELGAREARIHEVRAVEATHLRLAEWLPKGAGLQAPERRIACSSTPLGAAVASREPSVDLPQAIVIPIAGDGPVRAAIELCGVEMAVDPQALASLLELTRVSLRPLARRVGAARPEIRAQVLVIEDKVVQTETTARMLRRLGCHVTVASGMLEGLHALCATQFDLVLMDTHMPGIAAAEALAWLRGRPQGAFKFVSVPGTRVIALAAQGLHGEPERFRELGFDDCLYRPFRRRHLLAMLSKHVRLHAPATEAAGAGIATPVLDPVALARLHELDPKGENQLVERVLKAFQTSAARLLPQLQAARESKDRATVRLVAHTLKSSSASIGAMELSQICSQLEAAIRNDADDGTIESGIVQMSAALDIALQAIQRLLDSRT